MSKSSRWQLQEAKARLSELVRRANAEGPQHVSVRGEPAVVVVSEHEYRALTKHRTSIVDYILDGELWDDELAEAVSARPPELERDVDL